MNPAHAVAIIFGLPMLVIIILCALEWAARTIADVLESFRG